MYKRQVIDRLNDAKQDQAGLAAKLVRNILTEVLPYMNIFMTEELSDEEREELAARQLEVTNKYTQTPEGLSLIHILERKHDQNRNDDRRPL